MKKILVSLLLAALTFLILNFLYSNLRGSFNTPVIFEFSIPYLLTLQSTPIPLGFILIVAFCFGMFFLPLLQLLWSLVRSTEVRLKNKRIRELEQKLEELEKNPATPDPSASSWSNP